MVQTVPSRINAGAGDFGRKEVGIFRLLSPISNALLDPAKLMYLDEKTLRAEDSAAAGRRPAS